MKEERGQHFAAALWLILKRSAKRLSRNSPLLIAGATAFFATFSLAPVFVIIIKFLGSLIGKGEIKKNIIDNFAESAPDESVNQLLRSMESLEKLSGKWYINAGLFLFLFFTATTLFMVIRNSLYRLWRMKRTQDKTVWFKLKRRLFSLALIISAGILLVIGLLGQGIQAFLGNAIAEVSPAASGYFQGLYKHVISLVVAWGWFTIAFRYLTDARPQWKTALAGAFFTAILFTSGKLILQSALSTRNIPVVFGASASLVIMQLFVFYISLLIYYGAAFTMEWSHYYKQTFHFPDYISFYSIEERTTKEDLEHDGK